MDFLLEFYIATSWNSIIHQTKYNPISIFIYNTFDKEINNQNNNFNSLIIVNKKSSFLGLLFYYTANLRPISYFYYLEVAILASFSYSSSYSHSITIKFLFFLYFCIGFKFWIFFYP